jgi:hypothetical protein
LGFRNNGKKINIRELFETRRIIFNVWVFHMLAGSVTIKRVIALVFTVSFVLVLVPTSISAQDPIPSYGNNVCYLGSYEGNVEADEQYLTADIEQIGSREGNTTASEWFHIFPHTSARLGIECKEMYFYQQPATTDDLLYFDTTKDTEIVVHAEFDDTLVNLSAELQYGRDEGHNTVFGKRAVDTDEDGDNYYHFSIRVSEEVLENHVSLCLYIYYNVTITQSFEGTVHTDGTSTVTYPLLPPPEGVDDDTVGDDDVVVDDDTHTDDDTTGDDDTHTDDDISGDDDTHTDDDDDTHEDDDEDEAEDSPGFGLGAFILASTCAVWGFRRRKK